MARRSQWVPSLRHRTLHRLPHAQPSTRRLHTDDLVVQVSDDDYQDWRAGRFSPSELLNPAMSGDNADPDLDGHTNYQEYLAPGSARRSAKRKGGNGRGGLWLRL
jgi:hypothetical protein